MPEVGVTVTGSVLEGDCEVAQVGTGPRNVPGARHLRPWRAGSREGAARSRATADSVGRRAARARPSWGPGPRRGRAAPGVPAVLAVYCCHRQVAPARPAPARGLWVILGARAKASKEASVLAAVPYILRRPAASGARGGPAGCGRTEAADREGPRRR